MRLPSTATAARACLPASPKIFTKRSLAPLMTAGLSENPSTAFTKPLTKTMRATWSSEPAAALMLASVFSAQISADLFAVCTVCSFPTWPTWVICPFNNEIVPAQ